MSTVSDVIQVQSESVTQTDSLLSAATKATLPPVFNSVSPALSATSIPSDDPLITAGTACALAGGISRMTLWRWREAGIIPEPIVIRGRNYFRRSAFLAAIAAAA